MLLTIHLAFFIIIWLYRGPKFGPPLRKRFHTQLITFACLQTYTMIVFNTLHNDSHAYILTYLHAYIFMALLATLNPHTCVLTYLHAIPVQISCVHYSTYPVTNLHVIGCQHVFASDFVTVPKTYTCL